MYGRAMTKKKKVWGKKPDMEVDTAEIYPDVEEDELSLYGGDVSLPAVVLHDPWMGLDTVPVKESHLTRNRIIVGNNNKPARASFDVLRTRLLHILKEQGWSRVAITSPTDGCGKSFVAANLALSLARREDSRTVLMDMNLRNPSLAKHFGITRGRAMRDFLVGKTEERDFLLKINSNLAIGLNNRPEEDPSELLQSPRTQDALEVMQLELQPDVVLYDMPSALFNDELLSFLPQVDGVLLVVGGGKSTAAEVRQVEKLLHDQIPLLGVILNSDEGHISSSL
jgi:Mrp family chromosome partitioning ATPase